MSTPQCTFRLICVYLRRSAWLIIVSLFALDRVTAQTGANCFTTTCADPRHIRMDAVFDEHGRIVGGCNCICNPAISTTCAFPAEFDHLQCECGCPSWRITLSPVFIKNACGVAEFNHDTCSCYCPLDFIQRCTAIDKVLSGPPECACQCPTMLDCQEPGHIQNPKTCECGCPPWTPSEATCSAHGKVLRDCKCQCPTACTGPGQIQDPITCKCGCPTTSPDPVSCMMGVLDPHTCRCNEQSAWCCLSAVPNFKAMAGRCWRHQNDQACLLEPDGACAWDYTGFDCLPNPPVNSLDINRPCAFRNEACSQHSHCCSEVCRVNGVCR